MQLECYFNSIFSKKIMIRLIEIYIIRRILLVNEFIQIIKFLDIRLYTSKYLKIKKHKFHMGPSRFLYFVAEK